jgi:hypothetical protein
MDDCTPAAQCVPAHFPVAAPPHHPAAWPLAAAWSDNLGALFTHDGIAETIYSTSTVDVGSAGTTTIDYWAVIPSTQQWLHATRNVVIQGAANDNTPLPANTPRPPVHLKQPTTTRLSSTCLPRERTPPPPPNSALALARQPRSVTHSTSRMRALLFQFACTLRVAEYSSAP